MQNAPTIALPPMPWMSDDERVCADDLACRRTVRDCAPTPALRAVTGRCQRAAGTAPSGANHQTPDIRRLALDEHASFL